MAYTWRRVINSSFNAQTGSIWLHAIPSGSTYVRVRFRWGLYADTKSEEDLQAMSNNLITWGLATTIGNGTETPPNPRTQSGDVAPPTQRWIYWETRAPIITAVDAAAGVVTWRDSGPTEQTDTKAEVLATGLPGGDTLNLWAVWASPSAWPPFSNTVVWGGWSMLVKS